MKLQLLSPQAYNTKIGKNEKEEYIIYSLNLRPFHTAIGNKIYNTCPFATSQCVSKCVGDNGHFSMRNGRAYKAQERKTKLYFEDPDNFYRILYSEIEYISNKAAKQSKTPVLRLNTYSDINHLKQSKRYTGRDVYSTFDSAIFYDYTKDRRKALSNLPDNYSVTFSYNSDCRESDIELFLSNQVNVSLIFEETPTEYKGIPVFDGDKDDNRFLDPKPVIVGLYFKGSKRELLHGISTGFVIPKSCAL